MTCRFHRQSEHGPGPRHRLEPHQRLDWRLRAEKAFLAGHITAAAWKVARALERLLGPDGRLDPSYETLASVASVGRRSVPRALAQLAVVGLVRWTRRLVTERGATRQTSNAYELLTPEAAPPSVLPLPVRRFPTAKPSLDSFSAIVALGPLPLVNLAAQQARIAAKFAEERRQRASHRLVPIRMG